MTHHIICPLRHPENQPTIQEIIARAGAQPSIEDSQPDEKPETPEVQEQEIITSIQTSDFAEAFYLSGELGKKVHNNILEKYSDIEAITKVIYVIDEDVVKGSNPFYVVAVNEELKKLTNGKIRTATQADLERILRENKLPLEGNYYEDSGLVLGSNQAPNEYLATDIYNQFQQKGITLKQATTYLIQLQELSLEKDSNSPHKLSFILPENSILQSQYFEAPILNEISEQKYNSSDVNINTGLPKEVSDSGDRTFFTRQEGLSRLYIGGNLNLDSDGENLADSGDCGRVVCVAAEGSGALKNGGNSK